MLKHRLKEPFGKAGLTVAIFALVMALVGGAYAAGGLTKSQEKQVTKIAKKYAGKPGVTGPAGPAGATGAAGPAGAAGKNGKNGEQGIQGEEGSPWTAGGTLPSGSTETGTWFVEKAVVAEEVTSAPISFPIPLAVPAQSGKAAQAEYVFETPTVNCPGSYGNPSAKSGFLCIYAFNGLTFNATFSGLLNLESFEASTFASRFGTLVKFESQHEGVLRAEGSWAVKAP